MGRQCPAWKMTGRRAEGGVKDEDRGPLHPGRPGRSLRTETEVLSPESLMLKVPADATAVIDVRSEPTGPFGMLP